MYSTFENKILLLNNAAENENEILGKDSPLQFAVESFDTPLQDALSQGCKNSPKRQGAKSLRCKMRPGVKLGDEDSRKKIVRFPIIPLNFPRSNFLPSTAKCCGESNFKFK